jgi:molybdate transport system substrate-binding protein
MPRFRQPNVSQPQPPALQARWRLAVLALPVWAALAATSAQAAGARIAVAASFADTARALAAQSGLPVEVVSGATGQLYAQIRQGAPFDALLAADLETPARLHADGMTLGPPQRYAMGRLVLWVPQPARLGLPPKPSEVDVKQALRAPALTRLALANPATAPYGHAAQTVLQAWGLWAPLQSEGRLAVAENAGQVLQFVGSVNAVAGFVAAAQWQALPAAQKGLGWPVPASAHPALPQAWVLLKRTPAQPAAKAFVDFVMSARGQALLRSAGYD